MKPSELFPGAVLLKDGAPIELSAVSNLWITVGPGTMTLAYHIDEFMPLTISPAVLRGLGAIMDDETGELMIGELFIDQDMSEFNLKYAHQYQSILLHLFEVELVWNQSEYEQAMKEETK